MKRLFVLALILVMMFAIAMPASALENKFGGYWEAAFSSYKSLDYQDDGSSDYSAVRTRTRLYYTAVLHEKLKFINKFEMDTVWGQQTGGYGDLGADGIAVEVKNSYVDFNLGQTRWEMGTQGFKLHRGFAMNDDASGLKVSYRGADNMIPAFWWFRLYDGDKDLGNSNNGANVDQYTALVNIKMDNMQFVPTISYLTSNDSSFYTTTGEPMNVYFVGLDFNMKADMFDLALTGIYEGGELDDSTDISAYALYGKVKFKLGQFGIRATALYTTGEDVDSTGATQGDFDGFWYPEQSGSGASFSTAEFYRKGKDWSKVPNGPTAGAYNNAPNGNAVENRMEFGVGVDFAPAKDWKVAFDYWNLNLAEDAANGESDIGNEFDLVATWGVMKNLNLDLIGAYLLVGDAIKPVTNDANAYELSARLRLSF